jgi:hypothetical protein
MPYTVSGEPGQGTSTDFSRKNYDYTYPDGLDLHPKSDFHNDLKSKILTRVVESRNEMSKRYSSWNEIDRVLTTYIPLKDKEKALKTKDTAKPVSIVFPYTYSMLESLLTYLSMAFFQDPIFPYEGHAPEDTVGAMLLELVVRLHCTKMQVPLNVHTILRNSLSYGIGPGAPSWKIVHGKRPVVSTVSYEGGPTQQSIDWVEDVIFEGNRIDPIDPYMWLPDPSVASHDIQSGEYVGWLVRDNLMSMLSDELDSGGEIFNVKYLKAIRNKKSSYSIDQSDRYLKYGGQDPRQSTSASTNHVDNIYMYINLIPKEWKLGSSEYPEKWLFTLSSDEVITSASKVEHAHGLYPAAVASPEFDGFSPTPIGRLEILYGLQHTLDWLFNSHIANVRKAINDVLIVDPYLINIKDLQDPEPGKLVRLRRPAWGRGVDKVVQQLAVNDITRQNIGDSVYITQWMDRISGTDQSMGGALRQGGPERLTKSEFQGTRGSGIARLQRMAMLIGMQFMQPIAEMFAFHTQQYMQRTSYVKLIGEYKEKYAQQFGLKVPVTPYDLAISYDVISRDGSIPGGNFSDAWLELYRIIATDPALRQQYDTFRIFEYIATELGAKNIENFRNNQQQTPVQPTVMQDDEVIAEAEKGNLIPAGGL